MVTTHQHGIVLWPMVTTHQPTRDSAHGHHTPTRDSAVDHGHHTPTRDSAMDHGYHTPTNTG